MSTQVDFYLFEHNDEQRILQAVCRLANKAVDAGLKLFIHTSTDVQTRQFDDALWSLPPESFTPHCIVDEHNELDGSEPIQIGTVLANNETTDMLISLCETLQSPLSQFSRIADIVPSDEISKSKARQRYAIYRDQGATVNAHTLK